MSSLCTLPHTHTLYLQLLTQEPGRYYLHLHIHIIQCCTENKFMCCDCTILCNPFQFLSVVSLMLPTRAPALLLWIPYIKFLKETFSHVHHLNHFTEIQVSWSAVPLCVPSFLYQDLFLSFSEIYFLLSEPHDIF